MSLASVSSGCNEDKNWRIALSAVSIGKEKELIFFLFLRKWAGCYYFNVNINVMFCFSCFRLKYFTRFTKLSLMLIFFIIT